MSDILVRFRPASLDIAGVFRLFLADYSLAWEREGNVHYQRPPKTLILLHGYAGDETEWVNQGQAELLCRRYNLHVVIPNGYTTFYLDRPDKGHNFCSYLGHDLMMYLRNTFGIAARREDVLIAGVSMGGFGALHTAFAYPENFGGIIALSSGLIQHEVSQMTPASGGNGIANYEYYAMTVGEPQKLLESDNNPEVLVDRMLAAGKPVPRIFMACGTEDFLLPVNEAFHLFLLDRGIDAELRIGTGKGHNYSFWNEMMKYALPRLL